MSDPVSNLQIIDDDNLTDRFLTFIIDNERYGIGIEFVTEIIGIIGITPIPKTKPHIKGIINLRGLIVPVVSIRNRFNLEEIEYDERTCIVVINYNDTDIGLIVDEVLEVIKFNDETISQAPSTSKGSQSKFLNGIGQSNEDVFMLIDLDKLLNDE